MMGAGKHSNPEMVTNCLCQPLCPAADCISSSLLLNTKTPLDLHEEDIFKGFHLHLKSFIKGITKIV